MGEEELDGDGRIWGGRLGMVAYSMGGKSDVYFCISIFTALQSVVWDLHSAIGTWHQGRVHCVNSIDGSR